MIEAAALCGTRTTLLREKKRHGQAKSGGSSGCQSAAHLVQHKLLSLASIMECNKNLSGVKQAEALRLPRHRVGATARGYPHCSDWSESQDKKDRQGIREGLGLFSFTRLGYCSLDADRLRVFYTFILREITFAVNSSGLSTWETD